MAHPECNPEVFRVADFVGSTSKIYSEALTSNAKKFIVATEIGLLHRMKKERKDAIFIPAYDEALCMNMKLHTLEKIYLSLKDGRYRVRVLPKIMTLAKNSVEFMLKTKETLV